MHDYPLKQRTIGHLLADKARRDRRPNLADLRRAALHLRAGARSLQPLRQRLSRARRSQGRSCRGHDAELPGIHLDDLGARQARRGRGAAQHRGARRTAALFHHAIGFDAASWSPPNGPIASPRRWQRSQCAGVLSRSVAPDEAGRLAAGPASIWRASPAPAAKSPIRGGARQRSAIHHVYVGNDRPVEGRDQPAFAGAWRRPLAGAEFRLSAGRRGLHLPAAVPRQCAVVLAAMRRLWADCTLAVSRALFGQQLSGTRSGRPAPPSSTRSAR